MNGEGLVSADKLSIIPWPLAMAKAVDIVQLAGELELDSAAEESASDNQMQGEESFQAESLEQGQVVLHGIESRGDLRKGETDGHSLAQWGTRRLLLRAIKSKRVLPT